MKVYLITQHEKQDSIGFGCDFKTECYLLAEKAERRYSDLMEEEGLYSGFYYSIQEIEVIQ